MNKRARNRLIGVTAIIMIAVGAIIFGSGGGAYMKTVAEIADDKDLIGKRVKVSGEVVPDSWEKNSKPMRFKIREAPEEGKESDPNGPQLTVIYPKSAPSTFGNKVIAVVTGTLEEGGVIQATDLLTKCPSKYESKTGADTVDQLLAEANGKAVPMAKFTGFIAAGSIKPATEEFRFAVSAEANSGNTINVKYDGALPEGMNDGSEVVVTGSLGEDGVFTATDVALPKTETAK